ncbi:MAG: PEP/pyruvate-binding domain-containing protein [Chitinophagales bacterium]
MSFIKHFSKISIKDVPSVGGKNASLGEMYVGLSSKGVSVPEGFAVTSSGYWEFLKENQLEAKLSDALRQLDLENFNNLSAVGKAARALILSADFSCIGTK